MFKFHYYNNTIFCEEFINEENIFIDKDGNVLDKTTKKKAKGPIRALYIGDPSSHGARLKVSEVLDKADKNKKPKTISIGTDKGTTQVIVGDKSAIKITNNDIDKYYQLFDDNFNLLYYAYDHRNNLNQPDIDAAFMHDSNLRKSYDPNKKGEGDLANPNIKRDRITGDVTYTIYKTNKFGSLEPTKITKDIHGNIISESRAY